MSAKRFFFVSAGILCLALAAAPSAKAQTLWVFDKYAWQSSPTEFMSMGIATTRFPAPPMTTMLKGTLPQPGTVGEVAVEQHVISVGQDVPLPKYADGTVAQENEVFWTINLWRAAATCVQNGNPNYGDGDGCSVSFTGRTLTSGSVVIGSGLQGGDCAGAAARGSTVEVLVTVIAIRNSAPTPASQPSWGSVKVLYR